MDRVQPWNTSLRDIIISFFKCQTTKKKKRKVFPVFFSLLPRRGGSRPNIRNPIVPGFSLFFLERKKERKDIFEIFYLACAIQYFLQIILPFRKKKKTNEELNNEIITNRVQT
jgi:hypothetical protein